MQQNRPHPKQSHQNQDISVEGAFGRATAKRLLLPNKVRAGKGAMKHEQCQQKVRSAVCQHSTRESPKVPFLQRSSQMYGLVLSPTRGNLTTRDFSTSDNTFTV